MGTCLGAAAAVYGDKVKTLKVALWNVKTVPAGCSVKSGGGDGIAYWNNAISPSPTAVATYSSVLVGSIKCLDGVWRRDSAACAEKGCPPTDSDLGVPALQVGLGSSPYTGSGTTTPARCDAGWTASGSVKCVRGTMHNHTAVCVREKGCTNTTTDLKVTNLRVGLGGGVGGAGETPSRNFTDAECEAGYNATGTIVCIKGKWGRNTAGCDWIPENPCNATTTDFNVTGLQLGLGAGTVDRGTTTAKCVDSKYVRRGSLLCINGTWDVSTAACDPRSCPTLRYAHGKVSNGEPSQVNGLRSGIAGISHGGTTPAACLRGYAPSGVSRVLGCQVRRTMWEEEGEINSLCKGAM